MYIHTNICVNIYIYIWRIKLKLAKPVDQKAKV